MKKNAIFLATNEGFVFTTGTLLLSLKQHSLKLIDDCDILIYTKDVTDESKASLNKILPCIFVEYNVAADIDSDHRHVKKMTQLTFARYEIFTLLKTYEKILYLDVDILINKDIGPIFNCAPKGLAMARDYQRRSSLIMKNFIVPPSGYDMTRPCYNAGVILFTNKLEKFDEMRSYCYSKTVEMMDNLIGLDQGVLNLLLQDFKIDLDELDPMFNCLPARPEYLKKNSPAFIYHCASKRLRFWNYTYFAPWEKYYKKWLELGGKAHDDKGSFWYRLVKTFGLYKFSFFDRCPNPLFHPSRFAKYMFR